MAAAGRGDAGRRDRAVAEVAARQYGVVSRAQLEAAGLGPSAIKHRIAHGRLHRIHRGVYAVGHRALAPGAREMAAVLACGPSAVVSHRSAARLWRLLGPDSVAAVEVTILRSTRASRPGIRIHRSDRLPPKDIRRLARIPVTSPARTLLDFADDATERELERAFDEALVRRLTSRAALVAVVERSRGRRGAGRLRGLVQRDEEPAFTRSEAEERFLALVRAAGLPAPQLNVELGGYTVDFLWRAPSLVVEIDGYRFHSTRSAFERDRVRDARLGAAGHRVMRVTWRQLVAEPHAVVARLAQALLVAA
jgi:very-short-patch-repair endonuclease